MHMEHNLVAEVQDRTERGRWSIGVEEGSFHLFKVPGHKPLMIMFLTEHPNADAPPTMGNRKISRTLTYERTF